MAFKLDDLLMGVRNNRMQGSRGTRRQSRRQSSPASSPNRANGLAGMANHPAVEFGRQMTRNNPGSQAVDRLAMDVFSRLSSKGIYKDPNGTWQIKGMERPDVTRQIRDSAVAGMGGQEMLGRVRAADQGNVFGAATGPAANLPSNRGSQVVPPSGPATQQPGSPVFGRPSIGSGTSIPGGASQQTSPSAPMTQTPSAPTGLSGLGQRIAGTVQSRVGQSQAPSSGTMQSVVEARLRQQGVGQVQSPSTEQRTPTQSIPGPSTQPPVWTGSAGWPAGMTQGPPVTRPTPGTQIQAGNMTPGQPNTGFFPTSQPGLGGVPATGQTPFMTGGAQPAGGIRGVPESMVPAPGSGGTIGSYGNQTIDQWDQAFISAGQKYGVDPTLLKAMMEIESGGNGNLSLDQCRDDGTGIPSCGPMQIKPKIWGSVGSVPEQIEQAAKILADGVSSGDYATHRDALFGIYFPGNDPNGTTQGSYGARVNELQGQMGPYTPAPTGTPTQGGFFPGSNAPMGGVDSQGNPVPVAPVTGQPQGGWFPGSNARISMPSTSSPQPATNMNAPMGGVDSQGNPVPIAEGSSPEGPQSPKPPPKNVVYNPGEAGVTFDPNYVPTGRVGGVGGPPNMQPRAIMSPESTAYLDIMFTGAGQQAIADGYGFGAPSGCAGCYDGYYGWDPDLHPGTDISTNGSSQFNSLTSGTVVCMHGQGTSPAGGCGAYPDYSRIVGYDQAGNPIPASGNITIMTPDRAAITYGHSNTSNFNVGDTVSVGQALGMTGTMNGYHVHLEVKLPIGDNGEYILVDSNVYFNGGYCDRGFCPS